MKKFDKRLCAFSECNMLKPSGRDYTTEEEHLKRSLAKYLSEPLSLICILTVCESDSCSVVSNLCNPIDCMQSWFTEFSRQGYWSRLPFPSPGDLPDPGIEARSPVLQADSLPSEPPGTLLISSFLSCSKKSQQSAPFYKILE